MHYLLIIAGAIAFAYQLAAVLAALRHLRRSDPTPASLPPISLLKPVHGMDPDFSEAIRSHAAQDYPEFEILFGLSDPDDAAAGEIRRLAAEFPHVRVRLIHTRRQAPNGKAGVLAELATQARYEVLLVNDSDVRVPPGYLRDTVGALGDPGVGLVTCLYRGASRSWPGRWEALAIATDFAPSTLVAPMVGVKEFALGSTLLFRAEELRRIGGFDVIADYLADDYQLARRITGLGRRVHLSKVVVETALQGERWKEVWAHQLRWHRTIRVSRPGGYAGLPVTQATLWALLTAVAGLWWVALPLLAARFAAALLGGVGVLRCPITARWFVLIPLRDLWGVAVWLAGLFGNTVEWRDRVLRLDREGRIVESRQR